MENTKLHLNIYGEKTFNLEIGGTKYRLSIEQDEDAEDPRTFSDHISHFYCWHRCYKIGDDNPFDNAQQLWTSLFGSEVKVFCVEKFKEKGIYIKPLYLLDHSGIRLSTSDFNDQWDSGLVGFAVVKKQELCHECNISEDDWYAEAERLVNQDLIVSNWFFDGSVYQYTIEQIIECPYCHHEESEIIDSCSGFYGPDMFQNGMIENLPPEWEEFLRNKAKGGD